MNIALAHEAASTGSAASAEQLRDTIVRAAISILRERAFNEVRLGDIAATAGVEVAAVQAMFPSLNDVVLTAVASWNDERTAPLLPIAGQSGAVAFLRAIVRANIADPALMRVLTAMVNVAGTPGHPIGPMLRQQWIQFHAFVQRALVQDIEVGREPETMEPASGAEQLIALYEGLQLQSILRPDMDLLASFDRAVARLREGWMTAYRPTTWTI